MPNKPAEPTEPTIMHRASCCTSGKCNLTIEPDTTGPYPGYVNIYYMLRFPVNDTVVELKTHMKYCPWCGLHYLKG